MLAGWAIFAVWANRQLFNPENWSNTSTQLLQNKAVRNATANYLVDQLYANVDVAGEIKAKLPPQLQPRLINLWKSKSAVWSAKNTPFIILFTPPHSPSNSIWIFWTRRDLTLRWAV